MVSGNEFYKDKINLQIHLSLPDFSPSYIRAAAAFWAGQLWAQSPKEALARTACVCGSWSGTGTRLLTLLEQKISKWSSRCVGNFTGKGWSADVSSGSHRIKEKWWRLNDWTQALGYKLHLRLHFAPQSIYEFGSSANSLQRTSGRTKKKEVRCLKTHSIAVLLG